MACLESISETASEKPLSMSLYRFVIKSYSNEKEADSVLILPLKQDSS